MTKGGLGGLIEINISSVEALWAMNSGILWRGNSGSGRKGTDFWISKGESNKPPIHIAFRVDNRALVDAFYKAAIAAGGLDNGAPGVRPHYHPDYYGAFVLDPDGHNIEGVCHLPE